MKKILIISYHPAPYRDPLFNLISTRSDISLFVVNLFDKDKGHSYWGLDEPIYKEHNLKKTFSLFKRKNLSFHYEIFSILRLKWDIVIISGLGNFTNLFSAIYCIFKKKHFILNLDTISDNNEGNYLWKKIKKIFYSKAFAFWVPGSKSKEYFISKNINSSKIFEGTYTLNFEPIIKQINICKPQRSNILEKYKINSDNINLLMVGNFILTRNHKFLMHVFQEIYLTKTNINLILVGNGKEKQNLLEYIEKHNLNNIYFFSNISFNNLAEFYAVCDIYVHTGEEPYSTALQYAAISGCPIISSNKVGAAYDFINENLNPNGFILEETEINWVNTLKELINNVILREKFSVNSQNAAKKRDLEFALNEFESMVASI